MKTVQKKSLFILIVFVLSFLVVNLFPIDIVRASADLQNNSKFSYINSSKNAIRWSFSAPANKDADSLTPFSVTLNQSTIKLTTSQVYTSSFSGVSLPDNTTFLLYTITSNITIPDYSATGFWLGDFYLLVANDKAYGGVGQWASKLGSKIDSDYSDTPYYFLDKASGCDSKYSNQCDISTLSLMRGDAPVSIESDYGDPATAAGICKNTKNDWEDMKTNLRNLLSPMPGTDASNNQNNNWTINSASSQATNSALAPGNVLKSIAQDIGMPFSPDYDIKILSLSNTGTATFQQVQTDAAKIKAEVAKLQTMTTPPNTDDPTAACGSDHGLVTFKWAAPNAQPYTSLKTFLSDVDKYNQFAINAVGILQTPESSGSGNACGATSFTQLIKDFPTAMRVSFCNLALIIHEVALSFLKWAVKLFETVVGVKEY